MFDEDTGTAFRDILTLVLGALLIIIVALLIHINPEADNTNAAEVKSPGNVIVDIYWPDGSEADVDLWVQAPGDMPVGYSNKGGLIFNLLRDDLGQHGDATDRNQETAFSRAIPPGRYTVNVHLYRDTDDEAPIPVEVMVSVKNDDRDSADHILMSKVELRREGQELTVFNFKLDQDGNLVPGSVDSRPVNLR